MAKRNIGNKYVGREFPQADESNGGVRVLTHNNTTGTYRVVFIRWSTGEVLEHGREAEITGFKMSYRYDLDTGRVAGQTA